MDMSELKEIFKDQGWTLHLHSRRSKGKKYVYAAWREGQKVRQRYVAPLSQMEQMNQQEVLDKLATLQK